MLPKWESSHPKQWDVILRQVTLDIAASIKTVQDTRVGDTVPYNKSCFRATIWIQADESDGFRRRLYPIESNKYNDSS